MQPARLLTSYAKLGKDQVLPLALSVITQTTASTLIAEGDKLVISLQAAATAYSTMVKNTPTPTQSERAVIDGLRKDVRTALGKLAKKLNADYEGDAATLLSSGLELSHATNSLNPIVLPPTNVVLVDAPTALYLLLKFKRPKGATVTLIRLSTDADLPEENWLVVVGGGRERVLGPFAPGTKVWVKVAGLNSSTTEPDYSAVVCRIVQ